MLEHSNFCGCDSSRFTSVELTEMYLVASLSSDENKSSSLITWLVFIMWSWWIETNEPWMDGINKVSHFSELCCVDTFGGSEWYTPFGREPHNIPIEKWCPNASEWNGSKPKDFSSMRWRQIVRTNQQNEVPRFACVRRHLLVHWVPDQIIHLTLNGSRREKLVSDWFSMLHEFTTSARMQSKFRKKNPSKIGARIVAWSELGTKANLEVFGL